MKIFVSRVIPFEGIVSGVCIQATKVIEHAKYLCMFEHILAQQIFLHNYEISFIYVYYIAIPEFSVPLKVASYNVTIPEHSYSIVLLMSLLCDIALCTVTCSAILQARHLVQCFILFCREMSSFRFIETRAKDWMCSQKTVFHVNLNKNGPLQIIFR